MIIKTKLKGVSFGVRQEEIRKLSYVVEDAVPYVLGWNRERDNSFDSNSIVVTASPISNVDLGHLSREIAAKVAPLVDRGHSMKIHLKEITGADKYTLGVNIELEVSDGPAS